MVMRILGSAVTTLLVSLLGSPAVNGGSQWTISSPKGTLTIAIAMNDASAENTEKPCLSLRVLRNGRVVLPDAPLGITLKRSGQFQTKLRFLGKSTRTVTDQYVMPVGKKRLCSNQGNELGLEFANQSGAKVTFIFRAYEDGVAYRYQILGTGEDMVVAEASSFGLPPESKGWFARYTHPNYEWCYDAHTTLKGIDYDVGLPVLFRTRQADWIFVTEAAVDGRFAGARLRLPTPERVAFKVPEHPSSALPWFTPWRVAIIGSSLGTIVESTMVLDLSPPCEIHDTSWIKPGVDVIPWMTGPGTNTTSFARLKQFVDLASEMGWPWIEFDNALVLGEKWPIEPEKWMAVPWIPELVEYATSKGVQVYGWDHWRNLDTPEKREKILGYFVKHGLKGIKVDFLDSDSQERFQFRDTIARCCAERKLMLSFHGETLPRGLQRRWPNIVAFEGVKGEEYYLFGQGPTPAYNVNLVFLRNVVGSMDGCPTGFELTGTPASRRTTSSAHEMALAVLFESGWQSLSVSPESMKDNPAKGFLKGIPSAWDEIQFLDGYPGEFAVLARRKAQDWWVVGINAGTARDVRVPLDFLKAGSYRVKLYHDAPKDASAEAWKTKIAVDDLVIDTTSPLRIAMPANGGFGVKFDSRMKVDGESRQSDLAWLKPCNVVWETPSKESLGSMPLGNGDIGLNVWVEDRGDLQFYISKTDAFDGNHVNRKLGKIRVALKPNPFAAGAPFRQTLDLASARIVVQAGQPGESVSIEVWVDANRATIHVRGRSDQPIDAQVSVESLRPQRQVENLASAYAQPGSSDVLLADKKDRLLWCFRNESSSWSAMLAREGLGHLTSTVKDPLLHRTCGVLARGPGLVRQSPNVLATSAKSRTMALSIHVLANQAETINQWQTQLTEQAATAAKLDPADTWKAHCQWWADFWRRSRIVVTGCESAKSVTQGYALERFVQACAGRGAFSILFNGSIFTMDMPAGSYAFGGPRGAAVSADHRDWGSLPIMWQNTRLPYWSMLTRGDFDLMRPVFQAVIDALEVSKARSRAWYGHEGAVMTEAMLWKGAAALYPVPQHLRYHFTSNVEMPAMMYDYYAHTQDRQFLREVLLPCSDAFILFFEKHFPQRDARGKMVISPAGAVETYQPVTNPVTEVCGLRYLLGKLSAMDEELIGKDRKEHWRKLLHELPPIPTRIVQGQTLLAPGEKYRGRLICETPELYAVYPFRQATLWNAELLTVGRQSFAVRQVSLDGTPDVQSWQTGGWVQSPMQAAYLGLPKEAAKLVSLNFADQFPCFGNNRFDDRANTPIPQRDRPRARFPGFWETKMDYTPDGDHGANSANGLQSMLLQADDRQIFLLPAWPEDWNVEFKLHAPDQTVVECVYRDAKVQSLKVTPESRTADVLDMTTLARRVRNLVTIASGDHNDRFGLPPMPDGRATPADVARLKTTGPWLAKFGESLYGVRRGPFPAGRWGGSVFKDRTVYLHVLDWPGEELRLPALPKKIVAASVLTGGQVTVKEHGQELLITLPTARRDQIDTIIKLELAETIR